MKIILVAGIPIIFAIGYCVYLVYRSTKVANDLSWQDYPLVEFDDEDTFYGDKRKKQ